MIDSNDALRRVISFITNELDDIGEEILANEFRKWDKTFFTTSTELLGELKLILEESKKLSALSDRTKMLIGECICDIDEVLEL